MPEMDRLRTRLREENLKKANPFGDIDKWFPPSWKRARESMVYTTPGQEYVRGSQRFNGLYDRLLGRIWLNPADTNSMETVPHEYSHAAWDRDLDAMDRARWEKVFTNLIKYGYGDEKIFRRWGDDPFEAFARFYEQYVNEPEKLRDSFPEIYHYFLQKTGMFPAGR